MDAINIITEIYKQELAQANHQKVLFQAQCEIYKQHSLLFSFSANSKV